jgi:hypothetical protein
MRKLLLPITIVLMLGGCGTITNQYAAERTAEAPLPSGSGRIVLSTGAPAKCVSMSTYLRMLPAMASASEKQIALVSIDSYALKSDFADHQGNLHVLPIPAGSYYFEPRTDNPVVRSVVQPKATFSVTAGETVYLGEFYMLEACSLSTLYEIHDQMARDMALLKSKDPLFDTSKVTKRLMVLSGGVPPCDYSNRELTCR